MSQILNLVHTGLVRMRIFVLTSLLAGSAIVLQSADIERLAILLKDKDPRVRAEAAASLGRMGAEAKPAIPALLLILENDESDDVRISAIYAPGSIGPSAKTAIPPLLRSMRNGRFTAAAGRAIGEIDPSNVEAAELLVKQSNAGGWIDEILVSALGCYRPQAKIVMVPLRKLLNHEQIEVRHAATCAIGQLGPAAKAAAPDLVKRLNAAPDRLVHADSPYRGMDVNIFVVIALKAIDEKNTAIVPSLEKMLSDPAPVTRLSALTLLGEIGPAAKQALPAVKTALKDCDEEVRNAAKETLQKISQ